MTKLEKINKIVFHLGKGMWKGIPVIGPIVEEVFYEANKEFLLNELKNKISKIPQEELDKFLLVMESNESKFEKLLDNFQVEVRDSFQSLKEEIDVKPILIQNRLVEFKEKITKYACEWEDKIEEAELLGEIGRIKESQEAFMRSAKAINNIINAYRTYAFLFNEKVRCKIDKMLHNVENNDEGSLLLLIKAIQLMNFEIEIALKNSMKANKDK